MIMNETNSRLTESVGMLMIGDSVLGILRPSDHCLLWRGGPGWWRQMIDWFAAHPAVTRSAAVGEFGVGLWLAWRSESRAPTGRFQPMP